MLDTSLLKDEVLKLSFKDRGELSLVKERGLGDSRQQMVAEIRIKTVNT